MTAHSQSLEPYVSSDSSDAESDSENQPPAVKKRKNYLQYELFKEFNSVKLAKEYVKNEKRWENNRKLETKEGLTIYYTCKWEKSCPCKAYILVSNCSSVVRLYNTLQTANCNHNEKFYGISSITKHRIDELLQLGTRKPKALLRVIEDEGLPQPTTMQLSNYLRYKRSKTATRIIHLNQLETALLELAMVPADLDQGYVVNKIIDSENNEFRFFVSTPRLLSLINNTDSIQADTTYKLIWEGFPVLIAGTSDKNRCFHPFGICVAANETEADYKFMFESISNSTQESYKPKVLIADCADSITNGFREVFGDEFTRVYCWAHVIRNIDKKLSIVTSANERKLIRDDIVFLQQARSNAEFEAASKLLGEKWSSNNSTAEFWTYFHAEYIVRHNGWYEGKAPGYPSTNNGLESTNRVIKDEGTYRDRLPIGQFISVLLQIVNTWSMERNPTSVNHKPFVTHRRLFTKLLTDGYQYTKLNVDIKVRTQAEGIKHFYVPSSQSGHKTLKDVELSKYDRLNMKNSWKTFSTYQSGQTRLWKVSMIATPEDWIHGTCTCVIFQKQYMCKHLIGIAIREKCFSVPPEAKTVPIGQKRKRGRPAGAKKALIVQ